MSKTEDAPLGNSVPICEMLFCYELVRSVGSTRCTKHQQKAKVQTQPDPHSSDEWLDEALETLQSEAWRCGTNDESMHESDYWFEQAKVAITAHLHQQTVRYEAEVAKALTPTWWVTDRNTDRKVLGPFTTQHDASVSRALIERIEGHHNYWLEQLTDPSTGSGNKGGV